MAYTLKKAEGSSAITLKDSAGKVLYPVNLAETVIGFDAAALAAAKVELDDTATPGDGILKVYTIKQNGSSIGTINIPKDLVLTSGSVVDAYKTTAGAISETSSEGATAIKALKLVIANQTAPVYIDVNDLVDKFDASTLTLKEAVGTDGKVVYAAADATLQSTLSSIATAVNANDDLLDTLNGAATVTGSVKKQIKDAVEALDSSLDLTDTDSYVEVKIGEVDGKLDTSSSSVTVTTVALGDAVGMTYNSTDKKWEAATGTADANGLATAADVANEIVADEKVIATALNDHETRLAAAEAGVKVEDTTSGDGKISIGGKEYTVYTHHTQDAKDAAAVKVGNDAEGHVVLGAALAAGDIAFTTTESSSSAVAVTGDDVADAIASLATSINTVKNYTHTTLTATDATGDSVSSTAAVALTSKDGANEGDGKQYTLTCNLYYDIVSEDSTTTPESGSEEESTPSDPA